MRYVLRADASQSMGAGHVMRSSVGPKSGVVTDFFDFAVAEADKPAG